MMSAAAVAVAGPARGLGEAQPRDAHAAICAAARPCAHEAPQLAEAPARPARIDRPTRNGRPVDWCMERNPDWACGTPVAHYVCQQAGYRRATAFAVSKAGGHTWVVGGNKLTAGPCDGPQCHGFDYVMCER
jgi:hypothetical protein